MDTQTIYLIVLTRDGSNLRFYRNDTNMVLKGTTTSYTTAVGSSTQTPYIGHRTDESSSYGFDGKIYQAAVWKGSYLSLADTNYLYHKGPFGDMRTVNESTIVGNWKMDNASTVQDLTDNNNDGTVDGPSLVSDGFITERHRNHIGLIR